MPPVSFIEATGLSELTASTFGGATPAHARTGDVLLAVVGCYDSRDWNQATVGPIVASGITYTIDATRWSMLSRQVLTSGVLMLMRHIVDDTEPGAWAFGLTLASTKKLQGALLLYRGVDKESAIGSTSIATVTSAASVLLPSRTLAKYSDLYLGAAYCVTSNPAQSSVQASARYTAQDPGGTSSIGVFDYRPDVAGATGSVSTAAATSQTFRVASWSLSSDAVPVPNGLDPGVTPGSIGFFGPTLADPT